MKLTTTATTVIAEAETIAEALQLLALATPPIPNKPGKVRGHYKTKSKCPTCQKKYTNVLNHIRLKHETPDRAKYMESIRAHKADKGTKAYVHATINKPVTNYLH